MKQSPTRACITIECSGTGGAVTKTRRVKALYDMERSELGIIAVKAAESLAEFLEKAAKNAEALRMSQAAQLDLFPGKKF